MPNSLTSTLRSCRKLLGATLMLTAALAASGQNRGAVVADSRTHAPLAGASVFDSQGKLLGISSSAGRMPAIDPGRYPATVRYLGYREVTMNSAPADTVFMTESLMALPEVVVESRQHKVVHMLAYVREYSTLTSYTDTVFLFREKMVDFMLTPDRSVKFRGWNRPRILKSKSYYRFTNAYGLDSVSNTCNYHFSWSDWMGITPTPRMPARLGGDGAAIDTIFGKYSPAEIWARDNSRVTIDVDVMADTASRRWVPNLATFFRNELDFSTFRMRLNYDNVAGSAPQPSDLAGYSFNIESRGRGHSMFMFNNVDWPIFVNTYAEVYITDKEYITVKEAKKWSGKKFDFNSIDIIEPLEAPELQPSVRQLIARVSRVDTAEVRLAIKPDLKLAHRPRVKAPTIGQRALDMLRNMTGLSAIRAKRKERKQWNQFQREQMKRNNSRGTREE